MKPILRDAGGFLAIRTANPQMLYVDKTAYLHRLISSGRSCGCPRASAATIGGEGESDPGEYVAVNRSCAR